MLMKEAVVEDKTLGEVSTRIKEINEKQIESNIYSDKEISSTKKNAEDIDLVKNEKLKKVIDSLEKTVSNGISDENKKGLYGNAKSGYEESVNILEKITSKKLEELMENREMLEKQKELLKETQGLKNDMKNKDKMTDKDIDKMAESAEKQENLKNQAQEDLKNKMEKATEALKNMDLPKAEQAQQEIVKDLEKKINDETQNENAQNAEQMNDMQQMMQQLSDIQQQLQNQPQNQQDQQNAQNQQQQNQQQQQQNQQQPMTDQQRQDMAMKMDAVAEQMKQDGMEEGQKDMNKATEEALAKDDKGALSDVKKAMDGLQKAMAQAQQGKPQPGQPQPGQPQPSQTPVKPEEKQANDSKEHQSSDAAVEAVQKNNGGREDEWRAKLPEKERDALLAARKAKYTQKMEESVKRYFVGLAK